MKRFTIRILKFLLPVFLIALVMEILLRAIPNDYLNKRKYLDMNSDSIEVLILGDSHTEFAINPEYLTKRAFNTAFPSQSLNYDLEILEKYEAELSKLKFIVVSISYGSLFDRLDKSIERWRISQYLIYYKLKTSRYLPYYTEILSSPLNLNLYRIFLFYIKRIDSLKCTTTGWNYTYSITSKTDEEIIDSGKIHASISTLRSDKYYNEMVSILDSIIAFTLAYDINLVFMTTPVHKSYRDHLNADQWNKTVATVNAMSSIHENCIYVNMLDDQAFTIRDYFDADHLNAAGTKKVTMRLDSILSTLDY